MGTAAARQAGGRWCSARLGATGRGGGWRLERGGGGGGRGGRRRRLASRCWPGAQKICKPPRLSARAAAGLGPTGAGTPRQSAAFPGPRLRGRARFLCRREVQEGYGSNRCRRVHHVNNRRGAGARAWRARAAAGRGGAREVCSRGLRMRWVCFQGARGSMQGRRGGAWVFKVRRRGRFDRPSSVQGLADGRGPKSLRCMVPCCWRALLARRRRGAGSARGARGGPRRRRPECTPASSHA